jgi:hypothetical protein
VIFASSWNPKLNKYLFRFQTELLIIADQLETTASNAYQQQSDTDQDIDEFFENLEVDSSHHDNCLPPFSGNNVVIVDGEPLEVCSPFINSHFS